MSTATRIAIRSTQILTLAFLLVALAGGVRLVRAGEIDSDCEDTFAWAEETLELREDLQAVFADIEDAVDDEDPEAIEDASDDLNDAAEEQADLDVPAEAEHVNDEIVAAYEDAADAAADLAEAVDDEDEDAIEEGLEELAEAQEALSDATETAEELAEECEDNPNKGGKAETVELEVLAVALDEESEDPIEDAMFIILEEGIAFEEFDMEAYFAEGDEDQVLAVGFSDEDGEIAVEAEVEVDGEYTVILLHADYDYLKYWERVVFAPVDDADEFDFGILTLSDDVETN